MIFGRIFTWLVDYDGYKILLGNKEAHTFKKMQISHKQGIKRSIDTLTFLVIKQKSPEKEIAPFILI